jgi:hypothetical protein
MSERFRHECEVRWCLTKGLQWFEQYAAKVKDARGDSAARALWVDVRAQAALGNTGRAGDWRTKSSSKPAAETPGTTKGNA